LLNLLSLGVPFDEEGILADVSGSLLIESIFQLIVVLTPNINLPAA
jgi:hypothetical protein